MERIVVSTGRVLQFDEARGFGFIADDDGGEDVFLHASVFDGMSSELVPGVRVEFQTMEGDRGRKAYAVRLVEKTAAPVLTAAAPEPVEAVSDEAMCDVLRPDELEHELTEILLAAVPGLTGGQVIEVRGAVVEFARKHGWIDV
jgi:CspA family cold shock protein